MAKSKSEIKFPLPSKKELEEKAKYEEFWSDPCWQEPLDQFTMDKGQCSSHSSSS